jgi:hypothetical protein
MENTEENCEKIWKIWKKGKLKSEMIWKIWKISVLVIITSSSSSSPSHHPPPPPSIHCFSELRIIILE